MGTLLIMISNILNGENEELILYYVGCMISYLVECVCFSIFWFVAIPFTRTTTLEMDLEELHTKYMQGAISEEEYQLQKTQLLEKI